MSHRLRLDAELVRRGLARSRPHAASLISAGSVRINGARASKPATPITTEQVLVVTDSDEQSWASRGAHKLLSALEVFEPAGLRVQGRRCLDAGASTGGFTDVLLRRGAAEVVAVDVGYGQLASNLHDDERVDVMDRTNIRHITVDDLGAPVSLAVSDLSFISLTVVLPALTAVTDPTGDVVLMIKPQFEVGRDRLGKKGVVRDPDLHVDAILQVCQCAYQLGWGTEALAASQLPGPAGNVEYFCWLSTTAGAPSSHAATDVVAAGPAAAGEKV